MFRHRLLIRKWVRYATALFMSVVASTAQAIEEPAYTIEKAWEAEQIEIRSYAPRVMAVTTMQGDEDDGFPEQQRVVEYAADRVAPGGVVVAGESAHPRSV